MKRRMLLLAPMALTTFLLAGCATTAVPVSSQALAASIVGMNGYREFIPVDPLPSPKVTYYDATGKEVTKAWTQLNNKQIRALLPNIYADISIAKRDASGNLSYLVAKSTASKGSYRVVMDYTKYRPESVTDSVNQRELGLGRIGVGMRMTADIQTHSANVDLSSLFALGVAASTNKLSGTLSVQIIGISSDDVDALTITAAKIDETSIQKTLEGMAAIKAKIADEKTLLTPQILWVKPTSVGVAPEDVKKGLLSTP